MPLSNKEKIDYTIKEFNSADQFLKNIKDTSFFNVYSVITHAKHSRSCISKAYCYLDKHNKILSIPLILHLLSNSWMIVFTVYPIFSVITKVIAILMDFIKELLSFEELTIVTKTIEIPYYIFWTTTTTISEQVINTIEPSPFKIFLVISMIIIALIVTYLYAIKKCVELELAYKLKQLEYDLQTFKNH